HGPAIAVGRPRIELAGTTIGAVAMNELTAAYGPFHVRHSILPMLEPGRAGAFERLDGATAAAEAFPDGTKSYHDPNPASSTPLRCRPRRRLPGKSGPIREATRWSSGVVRLEP